MPETSYDPFIVEIETRLIKEPEAWLRASIRFKSGQYMFLLERPEEIVHDLIPSEVAGFKMQEPLEPNHPHQALLKWAISQGFPYERGPRELKHLRVELRNRETIWCYCHPDELNRKPSQPNDFFHFFSSPNEMDGKSIQWKFIRGWTDLDEMILPR